MKLVGFNLDKILAERKSPPKGKVNVNSNINIKSVEQEKVDIISDPILKFNFDFTIDYQPNIAQIVISGNILILADKNEAKEILKKFKTNEINPEIKLPLYNIILTKCNLRTLQLEEELGLPSHVPLPQINIEKAQEENNSKKANYTG